MTRIIKPGDPAFNGNPQQPEDPRPLVAVCMPCGDFIHHDTVQCLLNLLFMSQQFARPAFQTYQGSSISLSRNMLVKLALQNNADYILFIDSDMTFPGETLGHLMRRGRSVIGATYARRRPPFDVLGRLKHVPGRDIRNGGVHEAEGLPGGMMLVRTSVFRQLAEPWFEESYDMAKTPPFTSEDYGFCQKLTKAGITMWIDLDLSQHIGHLGVHQVKLPPLQPEKPANVMAEAGHA